ncbi:MAG TPA: aminoglycoside phosphotransferase family protein [Cryptosporangiaceae bacterium]|nr:aminoglycoside phosphotransferase family protein [Cryptosporangiaceae bacterium]
MATEDAFRSDLPVFQNLGRTAEERRWLDALPGLVAELERRWHVRTAAPYQAGTSSWVAPGVTPDGRRVVLKVAWPHREARAESAGLLFWAGDGAVLVHEADPERYALLLERCEPGTALSEAGLPTEDALVVAGELLTRLWAAPPGDLPTIESLGDVTTDWAVLVRERTDRLRLPFDAALIRHGAAMLESLSASAARTVLVHGDFNAGNLLRARRQPWLAIDAKPMLGDPGYDPAPLLSQLDPPWGTAGSAQALRHRFTLFADLVGEPVERLLAWAFARAVESAVWRASEGELADGVAEMAEAAVLADLTGL